MNDLNKGFHISPNIHSHSDIYEIEKFIESNIDLENKNILDVGCQSGLTEVLIFYEIDFFLIISAGKRNWTFK